MKLREKLFLTIGSLFLLTALSSYFLPQLFIKQDGDFLVSTFNQAIEKQRISQTKTREHLFAQRVNDHIAALDGNLLYAYESSNVENEINPIVPNKPGALWKQASSLLSYNPRIGYLSVDTTEDFHAAIVVDNAIFYTTQSLLLTNNLCLSLAKSESELEEDYGPYLGIRLPMSEEEEKLPPVTHNYYSLGREDSRGDAIYYFYDIKTLLDLPPDILQNLSALKPLISGISLNDVEADVAKSFNAIKDAANLLEKTLMDEKIITLRQLSDWISDKAEGIKKPTPKTKNLSAKPISFGNFRPVYSYTLDASRRSSVVRAFIARILLGIKASPFEIGVPIGATSFFSSLENDSSQLKRYFGGALLNKDIFFKTKLFDAPAYYEEHKPDAGQPPIANGNTIILSNTLGVPFIANTLKLSKTSEGKTASAYLTLGENLFSSVLDSFSSTSEVIAFLDANGKLVYSIDGTGNSVPAVFFDHFPFNEIIPSGYGEVNVDNTAYHFFQMEDFTALPIHIFVFIPDALDPTYFLETQVSNQFTHAYNRLSYQLLIMSIGVLGAALIIVAFISKKIAKPITILAKATEHVVKGQYSEIRLPALKQGEDDEIATLTRSFTNMIHGLQDKEKIRSLLDKVVSKEIATEILKGNVSLGGESKEVTILFADIRGFTARTERLEPEVVIKYLNAYMTAMSSIIEIQGGVIDKYVGDAIMALYGAPIESDDAAERAIKTALLMMEKLKEWNVERIAEGHPAIEIGIGIHTGRVVAGNMGADTRLNYTVLGANVNLASRLCSAATPMQIRVSNECLNASKIRDQLFIETLPPMKFKGFSEEIVTYAIKGFK